MTELNQQNSLLGKIAAYTEIMAKDPKSTIFVSLSEAYRKMGMLDDARQVIEQGLEAHSDFSPAHIVLARILCQQGEYAGSEAAFKNALEFDAESLAALVGYARLKILLGQETRARELLVRARTLSPADPVINKLLLSLPEESAVETVSEQVPSPPEVSDEDSQPEDDSRAEVSDPPPLASSTLADLYLKQGQTQQALDIYRQLSAEEPDNLFFRRKIKELEDGVGEVESVQEVSVDTQSPGLDIETATLEESSPDVAVQEETFLQDVECESKVGRRDQSDEKVITTLNRWLDSIQQRREDV